MTAEGVNIGISILLGILNIIQIARNIYLENLRKNDKSYTKSLVRSWQNHANGIKNSLLSIAMNPAQYPDRNTLFGNVQSLAQQAVALDKALVEERFYDDDKYPKQKKEESDKSFDMLFRGPKESK